MFQALAEKRIGRRDQANAWIWRLAEYTREVHEEYAVQRWPETKRLLGLLVNSSGGAHARNARRLVHASRKQDRRLSAALLAAAVGHTPEAEEVLRGARTRMARKPSALSRELLRNFPKGKRGRGARRRRKKAPEGAAAEAAIVESVNGAAAVLAAARGGGPQDAVVAEALAAESDESWDDDAPLDDEAREQIDEAVEEALDTHSTSPMGTGEAGAEPAGPGTDDDARAEPPKPPRRGSTPAKRPAAKRAPAKPRQPMKPRQRAQGADGDGDGDGDKPVAEAEAEAEAETVEG
jgi:hypothetical protein